MENSVLCLHDYISFYEECGTCSMPVIWQEVGSHLSLRCVPLFSRCQSALHYQGFWHVSPSKMVRYLVHLYLNFCRVKICVYLHSSMLWQPVRPTTFISILCFWLLYQESGSHRYVDLCLGLQFDCTNQHVC